MEEKKEEMPSEGGSYKRLEDGTLKRLEETPPLSDASPTLLQKGEDENLDVRKNQRVQAGARNSPSGEAARNSVVAEQVPDGARSNQLEKRN